jgi:cellulose synthase (UDP-forming)
MAFYFERFEDRRPPPPVETSAVVESLWQFLIVVALILGADYLWWRWTASLNYDALWFAIPLAVAESLAYFGLILFTFNLWKTRDVPRQPPPRVIGDCVDVAAEARPVSVDVFITSYSEDEELVRLSIRDARKLTYPHPISLNIFVLDDGRRPKMQAVCAEEGIGYITRTNNAGFKAGNLRNAMEQTGGDFIVICDADTRVFPTLLEHTLGYFRDPLVAWVQTPQWFYDIPAGTPLPKWLGRRLGVVGEYAGRAVEAVIGPCPVGQDPFINDPQMFYDIIQRRRNWANAAFCCGAGSVHRREAVMQAALRAYGLAVDTQVAAYAQSIDDAELKQGFDSAMRRQVALDTEFTPYKFHVSEDIYTSIVLHSDPDTPWKSVLHPEVESKMLSPQDLQSWVVQRFKYAGGTLDICFRDNPLFKRGALTFPQKVMYLTTFWSYLGCTWNIIFLTAPIVFLFTDVAPLSAYSLPFFLHFLPFIIVTELAFMFGTWGVAAWDGKAGYLSFFSINFRALWTVLRGEKIKFPVTPKDRQEGNFVHLVIPQLTIIVLTILGLLWSCLRLWSGAAEDMSTFNVNVFWGVNNIAAMLPMVLAAFWRPTDEPEAAVAVAGAPALAGGANGE